MRFEIKHRFIGKRYHFEIRHLRLNQPRGSKELMKLCDRHLRGNLVNLFLWPVQRGETNAGKVLDSVREHLKRQVERDSRFSNYCQAMTKREYLDLLGRHPWEAYHFAQWAVWYELSTANRKGILPQKSAFLG